MTALRPKPGNAHCAPHDRTGAAASRNYEACRHLWPDPAAATTSRRPGHLYLCDDGHSLSWHAPDTLVNSVYPVFIVMENVPSVADRAKLATALGALRGQVPSLAGSPQRGGVRAAAVPAAGPGDRLASRHRDRPEVLLTG
jgi:hypothetical protein